jgi:hypothetical protein
MATTLRTTDCVTTCDCCGKSGLKLTVEIELDCGDIVHYGRTCAVRNTGKTNKTMTAEINETHKKNVTTAKAVYFASAEYKAEVEIFRKRGSMFGKLAMEFVKKETDATDLLVKKLAEKFSVAAYEIRS